MKKNIVLLVFVCVALGFLCSSCTKDSNNKSDSSSSSSSGPQASGSTKCGIPVNNELTKKPSTDFLINATIDNVLSAELFILTPFEGGEEFLVKLPAVKDNNTSRSQRSYIYDMIRRSGTFVKVFKAQKDCVVQVPGGGRAYIASIVFEDGTVLAEKLLKLDYLTTDEPTCVNESIVSCYSSIKGTEFGTIAGDQVVSNFLWKPEADKDGKLVVLLNPYNATIYVNGEKLENTGPSNGRGTTARGKKPGCQYGRATIKVVEDTGLAVKFPDGNLSYTIANGCKRVEFK